jgi:hypothetical protein
LIWLNQTILLHLANDMKTEHHIDEPDVIPSQQSSMDPHLAKVSHPFLNPTGYQ